MAAPSDKAGTHWRKVHKRMNADLLFAEDIGAVGREVDVEIVESGIALVKGADESKDMPWLAFAGKKKKLALNVTNCKTMQSITGSSSIEEWRGWITLIVIVTTYFDQKTRRNETTEAIRIAPKRPTRSRSSSPSEKAQTDKAPTEKTTPATEPAPDKAKGWEGDPPLTDEEKAELARMEAANVGR